MIQYSQSRNSPTAHFVSKTRRNTARLQVGVKTLLLEGTEEITNVFHRGAEILPRKFCAQNECQHLGASDVDGEMTCPQRSRSMGGGK